jgi:hypothetical protein
MSNLFIMVVLLIVPCVRLFVKAATPLQNYVYCGGRGGTMSQTVMIEALGPGHDARARALDNVFAWIEPYGLDGKRVAVLLGDAPVGQDLMERTVRALSGAARVDLAARSLARYDQAHRGALTELLGDKGSLIELSSGEYESLNVPTRSYARQLHTMQTRERRYLKQAFVALPLAEADLFVVVRGLEVNRFSGVHGFFATVLDCVPTKTRTEILSYAAYDQMGEALLDVWSTIRGLFLFGVLDGEQMREETFGTTAATGVMIAGIDPNDLDGYALIASGGRISYSPFSASASLRGGQGHRGRPAGIASNISLDEVRQRVPPGFLHRPVTRSLFGGQPVFRFSARPADFDPLVCPMGAIEEGQDGIPVVRRPACVACRWCLKQYPEASASRK